MNLEEEISLDAQYLMPTFKRYPVEFVRGSGMHLYDSKGYEYLDFLAGIGVCSLGHCHPDVVRAIQNQAEKLIHVSNYFYIEKRGDVAKKLSDMLSREYNSSGECIAASKSDTFDGASGCSVSTVGPWKTFFANSGAEANECAIKLARIHYSKHKGVSENTSGTPLIVTLNNGFHGRTLASLASTGQPALHTGFSPIPEGFVYTPINDTAALHNIFERYGSRICAVMVECIQGESGVHPCSESFIAEVRTMCDTHDALMICDEVQCGIYRSGLPFAFQHYGITPDIVTMAKGIASGVVAGACSARADIADSLSAGTHGSTFGGSNLAIAASYATLNVLDSIEVGRRIQSVGSYLENKLSELSFVTEVRGKGLMCAAGLCEGKDAHDVASEFLNRKVVVNAPNDNTLRLLPPLICEKADVDTFIDVCMDVLDS